MNKEFKFPEKWYIVWENRENYEIISNYFDSKLWVYVDDETHSTGGVNYKDDYFNGGFGSSCIKGCTKITIEQFKKYVLKLEEGVINEDFSYLIELLQKLGIK